MRQNTESKLLEIFYERPNKAFTVREMTKLTKIPRATVHKYLINLKKQCLIDKTNKAKKNLLFKIKKINHFTEKIATSGLIDELIHHFNPSCIILFGSIRKGDSIQESDMDLFIESSFKKEVNLAKYEKKLKHKIQLFVEKDINKLQPHLLNNIINGIKIYGSFKIK